MVKVAKRARALARVLWYNHRKGIARLSQERLAALYQTLNRHHSKDPKLLTRIMHEMQHAWNATVPNQGWKCGPCKRMNSKRIEYCAICNRHWSTVQELTRDQQWHSNGNWGPQPPTPSTAASGERPRSQSRGRQRWKAQWDHWDGWQGWEGWDSQPQRPPKPKETPANKTEPVPPTPFTPYGPGAQDPPWAQQSTAFSALMNSQASSSTAAPELVKALKAAYSDSDKVPEAVQELLAKAAEDDSKQVIRVLHQTTNALGRAKKLQQDLLEQRRRHRSNWLHHLEESARMWQKQLEDFRVKQAEYQASLTKAQGDISAARNKILALNLKELPQPLQGLSELEPEIPAVEETTQDTEEERLRLSLQAILNACASSIGPVNVEAARITDLKDAEEVQERDRKRLNAGP
eukprot:Skav230948  [mRNA]  locus=scaffold3010:50676:52280:- [translate_table: standard]